MHVDVFNDTEVPELVHWHGQQISAESDGAEEEGSPFAPLTAICALALRPSRQVHAGITPTPWRWQM